jgi:nucleolar protein 15
VVERIERHLPEGTMPKRAAAEAPAKGDAKKAKKAATPKRSAGAPGKGGSGGKRDVRGDDIIKLSDSDGADSDADVDARAVPVDVARKAAKKMKSKMKTNVHGAFGREKDDRPRVLYIGHVPHGFYEDQMRAYFGQFGEVTRLRLSRNKKTGKSKHYAYCEFKHPEVAAIVAESMDNYLLFESVLKVRLMTAEECHPELWKGANRKFKAVPWRRKAAEAHDKPRSAAELAKRDAALLAGERARRRKIEKAGIEYDFPGYAAAAKGGDAKSAKKTAKRAATKKEKTEEKEAQTKATKAAKAPAKETKAPAKTPAKRKAPAAEAPAKKAKTPAKEKTPAKRATRSTRASAK